MGDPSEEVPGTLLTLYKTDRTSDQPPRLYTKLLPFCLLGSAFLESLRWMRKTTQNSHF
jgi:hypothetical protein